MERGQTMPKKWKWLVSCLIYWSPSLCLTEKELADTRKKSFWLKGCMEIRDESEDMEEKVYADGLFGFWIRDERYVRWIFWT